MTPGAWGPLTAQSRQGCCGPTTPLCALLTPRFPSVHLLLNDGRYFSLNNTKLPICNSFNVKTRLKLAESLGHGLPGVTSRSAVRRTVFSHFTNGVAEHRG